MDAIHHVYQPNVRSAIIGISGSIAKNKSISVRYGLSKSQFVKWFASWLIPNLKPADHGNLDSSSTAFQSSMLRTSFQKKKFNDELYFHLDGYFNKYLGLRIGIPSWDFYDRLLCDAAFISIWLGANFFVRKR